jgi:hypothetical protein
VKRRAARRSERLGANSASATIPRGSGLNHAVSATPPIGIGKMPERYAMSSVPGARSAPRASSPSSPALSAGGNAHSQGGGSVGMTAA